MRFYRLLHLHDKDTNIFKIPLVNGQNHSIERDTWLCGYESAFQLKQVQAFTEVVKEHIYEQRIKHAD